MKQNADTWIARLPFDVEFQTKHNTTELQRDLHKFFFLV